VANVDLDQKASPIRRVCESGVLIQIKPTPAQLASGKPRDRAETSMQRATAAPSPREETLQIAIMLATVGGYLDAYTWIVHRAFANAQTPS
jgi:hypothetical protein